MVQFIENILVGIRDWVNEKTNTITEAIGEIGFDEVQYSEYAMYTDVQSGILASGLVSKVGKTVTIQVYNAETMSGWGEICYRLPYAPD